MDEQTNRRVILKARPHGLPDESCFELVEEPLDALAPDLVRVRVESISIDPAMRAWIDEENYLAPLALGETMRGLAVGRVVESHSDRLSPGDWVQGPLGVQTFTDISSFNLKRIDPDEKVSPSAWVGALGLTAGMTAYFGLLECGPFEPGETVVMSAAAGAVGSIAGQIARIKGARVVGIAGGPDKCRYVTEELGLDACIDYKNQNVRAELRRLCPDGIDVYFDNVGGEMLDDALDNLAQGARVVLCGAITQYNRRHDIHGPKLYLRIAERNARMEGFTADRFAPRFAEAEAELRGWVASGELVVREHVVNGIEHYVDALRLLFVGSHIGKVLLAP